MVSHLFPSPFIFVSFSYALRCFWSPILWASRRQKAISRSSLRAEYIALSQGCQNVLWILKLLRQIGCSTTTVPVYVDNQGAIETTKNGTHSERTEHMDVAYKCERELLQAKVITLSHCPTDKMTSDILTKALGWEKVERFRAAAGVERKDSSASLGERECQGARSQGAEESRTGMEGMNGTRWNIGMLP
jgi:hypothetical protein